MGKGIRRFVENALLMSRAELFSLNNWDTLDVTEDDGDTSIAVAAIQGVTITLSMEEETFHSADSVKPLDKLQHSGVVPVEIEYARFDGDLIKQVLDGSGGTTSTSWTDTSKPQLFSIDGVFQSRDSSMEISTTVTGISFPEIDLINMSANEYMQRNVSGEGMDITDYDIAAPA